jgi:PREDICTED: hypothetical protein
LILWFFLINRTEKNASQWSKNRITELLKNLEIDEPGLGKCVITDITSIEGEAFANNRKAKLIFFYEWHIIAQWTGLINEDSEELKIEGTVDIPNLSEENDIDEIEVQISVTKGDGTVQSSILKDILRNRGTELIRQKLGMYIEELKKDFAKDLILPTKDSKVCEVSIKHTGKSQIKSSTRLNEFINKDETASSNNAEDYRSLKLREEMKCTAADLYNVLTNPELITAFTRSESTLNPVEGGAFNFFDGNISGTFVSLEPNECLKQKWRYKSWPEGYFSDVTLTLDQKEDKTILELKQEGIPANDYERTEMGWKNHYFESIKRAFGFGFTLY